MEALEKKWKN